MTTIAVMVLIETDNPALDPTKIDIDTTEKRQATRQAVIDALPGLTRVVMITTKELAIGMVEANDIAIKATGLSQSAFERIMASANTLR